MPNGDEITPWIGLSTPLASQSVRYLRHALPHLKTLSTTTWKHKSIFPGRDCPLFFDFLPHLPPSGSVQLPTSPPASGTTVPRSAGLRGFTSRIRCAPKREDDIGSSELDVPRKPAELSQNCSVAAASTPPTRSPCETPMVALLFQGLHHLQGPKASAYHRRFTSAIQQSQVSSTSACVPVCAPPDTI